MEYGRHDHLKQSPARFLKKSCILHDLVGLDARRPVNVTGLRGPAVGWTRITELATSSLALHQQFQVRKDVIAVLSANSTRIGETANLGDVMRLWVRSWQINLFFGFFKDTPNDKMLPPR